MKENERKAQRGRPASTPKRKAWTVYADIADIDRINQAADKLDRPISQIVREAVKDWLDAYEKGEHE